MPNTWGDRSSFHYSGSVETGSFVTSSWTIGQNTTFTYDNLQGYLSEILIGCSKTEFDTTFFDASAQTMFDYFNTYYNLGYSNLYTPYDYLNTKLTSSSNFSNLSHLDNQFIFTNQTTMNFSSVF